MELDEFLTDKTQIALSNVANKRKARTPLMNTIFKYTKPSKTTAVGLVYDTATGKILPVSARTASNTKTAANTQGKRTRHEKTLNAMHIPTFAVIDADDIKGIPKLTNPESLETFASYVQGEIDGMEQSLEATREFHALGALNGKVMDQSGSEVYDLYNLFGLTKTTTTILDTELDVEDGLRLVLHRLKSDSKIKLRGSIIKGFVMLCGTTALEEFAFSLDAKTDMRNNQVKYVMDGFSDGFNYQGVDFVEYTGGIGDTDFIGTNEAKLVPIVDGLCNVTVTPGVGTDFVNKKGQKTFITSEMMDHHVGVELKAQSNYLTYLSVPDAVQHIEITITPEV